MNSFAQAMIDAGIAACEAGQFAAADAALRFAVGAGTDGLVPWLIGHVALRRDDPAAALAWLTLAEAIEPGQPMVQRNLGDVMRLLGRLEDATAAYRRAIAADPAAIEPYSALVAILHLLHRDTEALAWAEQALRAATDAPAAHRMLGHVLSWLNRHADAVGQYRLAMALHPDDALTRYHEGLDLLALGDFAQGWRSHEARLELDHHRGRQEEVTGRLWRGESEIAGETILLHAEQGLGDTLQFVRYVPMVAARGAQVWLKADAILLPLLASVPGIARLMPLNEASPEVAWCAPLLSLPLAFATTLSTIPAQVPYLRADPARVRAWRSRLGTDRRRQIGLAWSGNPEHPHDRLRSIPLARLTPLLARRDCVVHVIQPTPREDDGASLTAFALHHHGALLTDFAETAALMACLDLVISVDSAPAHLAGALGRPTWVLLAWHADWRWMRDRHDSPWYPTMRLFRQPQAGDWESVVAAVAAALDGGP